MRRIFALLVGLLFALPALAWNSAGHRLSAVIAWQFMKPETRQFVSTALEQHPDAGRWREKSGTGEPVLIFAEAATWADSIRHDPRYGDADTPALPLAGLPDNARHADWHYADQDARGQRGKGQLDRQIDRLSQMLRSTGDPEEIAWALPWLTHLIADLHQPLHVGHAEDRGGNTVDVVDDDKPALAPISLHRWWDDLPGPSSLRGKRLLNRAEAMMTARLPPPSGLPADWLRESRQLTATAYPKRQRDGQWLLDHPFRQFAGEIAEKQVLAAGYRLARHLDAIVEARVSRGTR